MIPHNPNHDPRHDAPYERAQPGGQRSHPGHSRGTWAPAGHQQNPARART